MYDLSTVYSWKRGYSGMAERDSAGGLVLGRAMFATPWFRLQISTPMMHQHCTLTPGKICKTLWGTFGTLCDILYQTRLGTLGYFSNTSALLRHFCRPLLRHFFGISLGPTPHAASRAGGTRATSHTAVVAPLVALRAVPDALRALVLAALAPLLAAIGGADVFAAVLALACALPFVALPLDDVPRLDHSAVHVAHVDQHPRRTVVVSEWNDSATW